MIGVIKTDTDKFTNPADTRPKTGIAFNAGEVGWIYRCNLL